MRLYGWVFGAVLGIFAVSATFCQVFSGFLAGFGCCFGDFCSFSYFLPGLFRLSGWVWVLFWGFLLFQLLFLESFPAFGLGLGCCFWVFCSFSYFFSAFLRLYGWVWGAVLGISAVSATFCEASGIMVEAQHHKLTTTYWKKPLVSLISRTQLYEMVIFMNHVLLRTHM